MNMVVGALCLAGMIGVMPATASSRSEGSGYGSYLADHYGFTCSGFVAAADASDPVRLQPYADAIHRLASQKWGSLTRDKLRRIVSEIVAQCEAHARSDFEGTVKEVIARSSP